ncbi:dolichyl-P-Glc:Man(9)GlcNAc(2)-PP-dolichol alpha-1,3-glucosyltransferase [Saccharomycopsis crataegensis]|uniref:Alpha-1,3-glucosyltransferase n=1 Tax=Saccharomycopsis crataegensis TaxID=43959 RepID=A0AAV5QUK9_9ASCO|nr:dolichyl-P-Glc:Man(9)GlcNAc(2)-PP-dolichol alpha-1,3-glucosyltransferase [Saccharomycopsis crataegensis]
MPVRKRHTRNGSENYDADDEKSMSSSTKKLIVTKPKTSESIIVNSPLYGFLSPFKSAKSQWMVKYIVILFALIIRIVVSFGPYSGEHVAPRFGDFEAQRHWLDLTVNLPISQWYYYNLEHWGLDYPPLTAYHSLLLGYIGWFIRPEWFQLDATDGLENEELKFFMRFTVIVSESLLYIPAVYYYTKWFNKNMDILNKKSSLNQVLSIAVLLFQPTLILIDHGHFQYNCVMLGFALLSLDAMLNDHLMLASIFFVFSLTFKQMGLFYAPLVFAYLLGVTFNPFNELLYNIGVFKSRRANKFDFVNLFLIALATVGSFIVVFAPLYIFADDGQGFANLKQSILRIFPFNRGIFEDKVANFWCTTNTLVKYKNLPVDLLKLSALGFTVLSILPACIAIYFNPIKSLLPWALASTSWGFFLFSFQVHEKSVLLPLLPTNLLFCYVNDDELFQLLSWINNIALFSLGPLLKRDKLDLQFYTLTLLSNWLVGNLTPESLLNNLRSLFKSFFSVAWFTNWIIFGSTIGAIVLDLVPYFVEAPANLPDLWVVGNITLSFICFSIFYLYITYKTCALAISS